MAFILEYAEPSRDSSATVRGHEPGHRSKRWNNVDIDPGEIATAHGLACINAIPRRTQWNHRDR